MRKPKILSMPWVPYASVTVWIALLTMVLHPFGLAFDLVNIALIYLFPVLLSAVYWGIRPAFFAAVLCVLAFDFYFVPPVISFTVADLRYLVSFGVYLTVAAMTASLAARLKQQLRYSKQREAHTAALYALSRQISDNADIPSLLDNVSRQISQTIGSEIAVYLPNDDNKLILAHRSADHSDWGDDDGERAIANWAYENGEAAGKGFGALREVPGCYVPLRTEDRVYGVLAANLKEKSGEFSTEQQRLLEAFAGLAASAIARVELAEQAKIAHLTAESERLRTAILDSVSHELRTPLAAIIGSATGLIEGDQLFSPEARMELLSTIRDGALRMNRLVKNLLGMVQLESGMLRLRNNWCDVEDLIGVALAQVKDFQQHRKLRVRLPEFLPMVQGDEVLLEQVLVNVVSNAIKYSPDGSEIEISVTTDDQNLIVSVIDQGTGLSDGEHNRIFEKFYRADSAAHVTGTGLGLAICKGIVELHGGTISAKPNRPQGTVITFALPLSERSGPPPAPQEKGSEEDEHE